MKEKKTSKSELPSAIYGEGSWDTLPSGKFRLRKKFTSENGFLKKSLTATGSTKQEAIKKMKQKEKEAEEQSRLNSPQTNSLQSNMLNWINLYRTPHNTDGSAQNDRIRSTFNTHICGSNLGCMQEQAITTDDIQLFLRNLKKHDMKGNIIDTEELSYSSTKKVFELLQGYFEHNYQRNPHQNPMLGIKKPVPPKKIKDKSFSESQYWEEEDEYLSSEDMEIWDDDEMDKLTAVGMAPFINGKTGTKNGPAYVFAMWIFCRMGELQALQWKDIDFENKVVHITKTCKTYKVDGKRVRRVGTPKTINGTRDVNMSIPALEAIKLHKERLKPQSENDFILPGKTKEPLTSNAIRQTYNCLVKQAGLTKKVTFHGLRHSGISYALRHGAAVESISRMAGHSSIDVTQRIYYQIIPSQKKDSIDIVNQYYAQTHNIE